MHAIAARHADAVGFTGLGTNLAEGSQGELAGFRARWVDEDVAALQSAASRRSVPLEMQVLVQAVVVTEDVYGAADLIARDRLPSLSAKDVLTTPYLLIGSVATIIDRLIEQRERWGFNHYTVRRDALGQFEPIISTLSGH